MPQMKLHPIGAEGQVVLETIPGGHEPREYKLYDNMLSARGIRWLVGKSFVPDIFVELVDDGRVVDSDILNQEPMIEEEFTHA